MSATSRYTPVRIRFQFSIHIFLLKGRSFTLLTSPSSSMGVKNETTPFSSIHPSIYTSPAYIVARIYRKFMYFSLYFRTWLEAFTRTGSWLIARTKKCHCISSYMLKLQPKTTNGKIWFPPSHLLKFSYFKFKPDTQILETPTLKPEHLSFSDE